MLSNALCPGPSILTRHRDIVIAPPVLLHLECSILVYIRDCPLVSCVKQCAGAFTVSIHMCVLARVCFLSEGARFKVPEHKITTL